MQTASLCKQKSIIQNIFQLCVPVLCHLGLMSPYTKPKCLVIDSALCALHPHRLDMFLLSFQPFGPWRGTHQLQQLRSERSCWKILPDEMNTVGAKTHSIIFTQGQSMGEFLGHDNDETPLLLRRYHPPAGIVRAKFIGKKKTLCSELALILLHHQKVIRFLSSYSLSKQEEQKTEMSQTCMCESSVILCG